MGVLLKACDYNKEVTDKLTTKCVYDWRLRDKQVENGETVKCWLRRSRLVAREYAFLEKRADTYSPASSTHILNLLPLVYLQKTNSHDPEAKAEIKEHDVGVHGCEGRLPDGGTTSPCENQGEWCGLHC